ncbi:MAG: hypothetical protein EZS28_001904 [Streblomastix strix]|uniref:Uncharacterized protein n=1 Tax=Streblomastix strix TaxID=222440 RepID=A0A5J4X5R8_9EUKA|nr:MAG: hypothetical protein EZS28_001904 [Streblomastix strix]
MRLTSFYESQIQSKIAEQNTSIVHIDTSWNFNGGTGEQQDEFHGDFVGESQILEIRPLDKNKNTNTTSLQQADVVQSSWTIVQLDELSKTARKDSRPVNTKLRSRQPTNRRQRIADQLKQTHIVRLHHIRS